MRKVLVATVFLLTLRLGAGETAGFVPDVFDPASARKPRIGEWLEYLVAYPVDPMENTLRSDPVPAGSGDIPAPENGMTNGDGTTLITPQFDSPVAWRVLPLRLEILYPLDDGYRARMTFEGKTNEVVLPGPSRTDSPPFDYDAPQPPDEKIRHRVGDTALDVEVTKRFGNGYGFIRYANADLPFGLARFATENVDVILVGMGDGPPPRTFPLPLRIPPDPAPGKLYRKPPENDG